MPSIRCKHGQVPGALDASFGYRLTCKINKSGSVIKLSDIYVADSDNNITRSTRNTPVHLFLAHSLAGGTWISFTGAQMLCQGTESFESSLRTARIFEKDYVVEELVFSHYEKIPGKRFAKAAVYDGVRSYALQVHEGPTRAMVYLGAALDQSIAA
jgi:hypothetical protein